LTAHITTQRPHIDRLELNRPVRWIESRQEHLMAVSQERDQIHDLEVAATKDGRILAIRDRGLADCGDGCEGVYWGFLMPFLGAVEMPNAYDVPKCDIKIKVAVTNKSALSPARAFGEFPTRFAIERALDMVARRCGLETAEVKRKRSRSCRTPRPPASTSTAATSFRSGTT
jgi:carbon-monoxide dehydrogenase large subunit